MTRERAIEVIRAEYKANRISPSSMRAAINVILEQEPTVTSTDEPMTMVYPTIVCDDAVSREAVDEIKELMTDINGDTVYAVRMSDLRQLPSVTQKSGKWILTNDDRWRECSCCRYQTVFTTTYCPNCGARMVEPQESEE